MLRRVASTDFHTPIPFEPIVRERLVQRLAAAARHRITVVAAPAGFGKSVAARHYLEESGIAHVRYGLRRENGMLPGFLRGFVAAIAPFAPDASESLAGNLSNIGVSGEVAHVAPWLAGAIEGYDGSIFIDDLHHAASDARICEILADVIERTPRARWILATRDLLELPVASWIAYGVAALPLTDLDLRLTPEDGIEIASRWQPHLSKPEVYELHESTKGWPVAFMFALRVAGSASDINRIARGTREILYAFLAEQILRNLDEGERRFLFDTAVLPTLDTPLLAAAGVQSAPQMLGRIRHRTGLVFADDAGIFRYHDLFAAFLDDHLEQRGAEEYAAACARAGSALTSLGRIPEALTLYLRAGCVEEIAALVHVHGFRLADNGMGDLVESALSVIPQERLHEDAVLLAVSAVMHALRSRADDAEAGFVRALRVAGESWIRVEVAHHYANLLVHPCERYADSLAVLEAVSEKDLVTPEFKGRHYAAMAVAHANLGNPQMAHEFVKMAIAAASAASDELLQVKIWLTLSSVFLSSNRPREAVKLARQAAEKSEAMGYPLGVLHAKNKLMWALWLEGSLEECTALVPDFARFAQHLGYHALERVCRMLEFELAVTRGDDRRAFDLEELFERDVQSLPIDVLRPFPCALKKARVGDFRAAYDLVENHLRLEGHPHDRIGAAARRALFAAAAGLRNQADEATAEFYEAWNTLPPEQAHSFQVMEARACFGLSALLLGRNVTCDGTLRAIESARAVPEPLVRFVRAIRAMHFRSEVGDPDQTVSLALANLRASAMGGYAGFLEMVSLPPSSGTSRFAALTKLELEVLRLLSSGLTSRDAAARMGRSALTVDGHVKSIAKKLCCSGRREAIALAREHGIV